MVRFNLLILALLSSAFAHEDSEEHTHGTFRASTLSESWSYLETDLPSSLSDADESILLFGDKKRIVITGGCDSPLGNEYKESPEWGGYFECSSIVNKTYAFDPKKVATTSMTSSSVPNKAVWDGDFEELADMPRARARHASAVVDNKMCLFGGRDAMDGIVAEVDCYDPEINTWSTPTTLPEDYLTSDAAAFARDSTVYLIGGFDGYYTSLDRVALIDMTDMDNVQYSWNPNLLDERGDIDVVFINDKAYVAGGYTHANNYSSPFDSVEQLDMTTQQWSFVDNLNNGGGDQQYIGLDGKIFAIGGETKMNPGKSDTEVPHLGEISTILDVVEVYDPEAQDNEWIILEDMPQALFRFAAAEWEDDGVIFVFGGQTGFDPDCECFRTTDKVLVFKASDAYTKATTSSGATMGGTILAFAVAVAACVGL